MTRHNKIYNYNFDSPSEQIIKNCRICLENECLGAQNLIKICLCIGSIKYVHLTCINNWIKRSMSKKERDEQRQIFKKGFPCEICKFNIPIIINKTIQCNSSQGFCQRVKKNIKLSIFFIISISLIASLLAIIFYFLANHQFGTISTPQITGISIATFLLSFSLLLLLYFAITRAILVIKKKISLKEQAYINLSNQQSICQSDLTLTNILSNGIKNDVVMD